MLESVLAVRPWLAILVWALTFLSDYYLTLYGARLHRTHAQDHIAYGGSYELTPVYQRAIESAKPLHPRVLLVLPLGALLILAFWYLSVWFLGWIWPFTLLIGGLLLREGAIHVRHMRTIVLFRDSRTPGALTGKIELSRWLVLHQSAAELWGFAALFLLVALFTSNVFMAGGALACAVTGAQHYQLSRKALHG